VVTLDKYLNAERIPQLPKWRKVLNSAEFVLATAQHQHWQDSRINRLQEWKTQLAKQVD
jgi:hypothetical protein